MNLNARNKLQEDSPEREEAIYNIAKRQREQNPEMAPITLELTKSAIDHFRIGGFHAYELIVSEVTEGGRHREEKRVEIKDNFISFVHHEAYVGLMKVIPATNHNLELLASHWAGNRWFIHEDEWRKKVELMAANVKPQRDETAEQTEPEFMPHVSAITEESAKKRLAELQQQIKAQEELLQQKVLEAQLKAKDAEPVVPQAIVEDDDDNDDDGDEQDGGFEEEFEDEDAPPDPKPLGQMVDNIKARIFEKHADEIMEMRKQGNKRIEMTREFRGWLEEERQLEVA